MNLGGYTLDSNTCSLTPRHSTQHPLLPSRSKAHHSLSTPGSSHLPTFHFLNSCSLCLLSLCLADMIRGITSLSSPRINSRFREAGYLQWHDSRTYSWWGWRWEVLVFQVLSAPSTSFHRHPLAVHLIPQQAHRVFRMKIERGFFQYHVSSAPSHSKPPLPLS